jgi:Protein of unknown function (DUF1501)
MLSIFGQGTKLCDGITRRELLKVGGLAIGGLTLADVLRGQEAAGSARSQRNKSVIMVWLRGGASHIDSYDMKPDAPPEIRGEFRPTATSVPGIQICDLMPRQAKMMDKLAIIRGIKSNDLGDHTPHYIITGSPDRGKRPAFGSVVSYLKPRREDGMPPYVSLMYDPPKLYDNEGPVYVGHAHRPFVPREEGIENLSLVRGIETGRLDNRRDLLKQLDTIRREVDSRSFAGIDEHTVRALRMIASPKVRNAFDLKQEGDAQRERYGKYCENLLMARRLVEAGISVVTLKLGDYDTHEKNFIDLRDQLPKLDQGIAALVEDLHERGLAEDVAVVVWGEFGRAPHISRGDGRDHWPEAGAAVIAGGGFKTGQAIGETDPHGGRSKVQPYTPANVLATFYRHLGIDPATTIPDFSKRPMYLLDDREPVRELL